MEDISGRKKAEEALVESEKKYRKLFEGSETILLVDDEELVADIGQRMLKKLGYRVIVAESGQKAIQLFEALFTEGQRNSGRVIDRTRYYGQIQTG